MREEDERQFHKKLQEIEGDYEVKTEWGKVLVSFDAVPNYAGGEGCPDEILTVKVKFVLLGTDIELSAPVLLELEKAGFESAKMDLKKFCERSITGEQKSYLEIPMVIIGGDSYKKLKSVEDQLLARFSRTQVPKRIID